MQRIVFGKRFYLKKCLTKNFLFTKTAAGCRSEVMLHESFIHPNRQVYFFASFSQNEVKELHKYIVIDAETKRELREGKSYHHCNNLYKNNPPILVGYFYSGTLINFAFILRIRMIAPIVKRRVIPSATKMLIVFV